jgi:hypothetical protein
MAFFLDKVHNEWLDDCVISEEDLSGAALNVPKLHSKWLQIHNLAKSQHLEVENEIKHQVKKRLDWYEGLLSKEEMDELGWKYDPFDGKLVKTKVQRQHFIENDEFIKEQKQKLEQSQMIIDTTKEILDNIRWRTQTIKTALEAKRFEAGF